MRAYRVLKYLHVPARLKQEPSRRKKKVFLALHFHSEATTCSVLRASAEALAQPPRILSPHVTFDCDPIGKPDLARRPLQSTGGSSLPVSAGIIINPVLIS
jgi:hypothetical protein